MNPEIRIRDAEPEDAAVIVAFNAAMAYESEKRTLDPVIMKHGVLALIENTNHGFYLIAEVDGEVVGQLMITYEWSDWRNAQFWWIQSVYVKPAMRGRGVFRALYRQVEAMAKKSEACGLRLYVEKDNSGAMRIYEKLGMLETSYRLYEFEFKD